MEEDHIKRIALLIPKTKTRAQAIYDQMLAGMVAPEGVELVRLDLNSEMTEDDVQRWLASQTPSSIIAIGKTAHRLASAGNHQIPIVVGGTSRTPADASGVTLAGDPAEFLSNVEAIAPKVKRIHLVYSEGINGWWVDIAQREADSRNLELITMKADSLKSGAKMYRKLLSDATPDEDAIWIPLVSIVPSKTVLPLVLKKAWEKHLVVFTNSATHTKQGALFSLYPDNTAIGEQLMGLALEHAQGDLQQQKVVLAKGMKKAFNWRTASHLGLEYTLEEEANFDRIYPVK